jgi:hypothetical protein
MRSGLACVCVTEDNDGLANEPVCATDKAIFCLDQLSASA